MNIGMLWRNDPRFSLIQNIQNAAAYHLKKYGGAEMCLIHPETIPAGETVQVENITVRPYRYVQRGHLWIGREERKAEKADPEESEA